VADLTLPFSSRIGFAFAAFFRILFDGVFAQRLWNARELLPASEKEKPDAEAPPISEAPQKPNFSTEAAEENGALLFLGLMQREGRLIDFLEQEISSFSDADVGAAARAVHEGSRRALRAHAKVEPVRGEDEGEKVTLEAGFDANAIKLTGNVRGEPPHTGTLKHPGWRAVKMNLPRAMSGHDVRILAPAEVEL
jgi:hypothetical protein